MNAYGRFRMVGWLEGASLLVLLGVAVPLKYLAGSPEAVRMVGPIHGFFFSAYCLLLADVHVKQRWPLRQTALFFVAAILPFGTFALDGRLRRSFASVGEG